ncbi:MAG TPA: integrase, partial [Alphaproteobacteria bacterium]|nr:integrase [Alphaproteobacteria bacterium]
MAASTLRRHFRRQGLTRQQLTSSKDRQNRFRRFEAERPHQLWQSDFHHTLYLPDPESEGKKRKVKLCA